MSEGGQRSRGRGSVAADERNTGAGGLVYAERRQAGASGIRRGVSIQNIANFEISWKGLDGTVPHGLSQGADGCTRLPATAALPTGARQSWAHATPARMTGL